MLLVGQIITARSTCRPGERRRVYPSQPPRDPGPGLELAEKHQNKERKEPLFISLKIESASSSKGECARAVQTSAALFYASKMSTPLIFFPSNASAFVSLVL